MKHALIVLSILLTCNINAQFIASNGDTIFNQTDKQGLKQGFWKAKYDDGTVKYMVFFKDDKPSGTMKRYFDDATIKAIMYYHPDGIRSKAQIYYQAGPIAAEGNYVKTFKDSTWSYYSYYTKTLSNKETYANGKKHGYSISYYSTDTISEVLSWKNGIRDGEWKQYFPNGVLKLSTLFANGKRTGDFILNYPDKRAEWKGSYYNDKREGTWNHFDASGENDTNIEYKNGVATNAAELEGKEQELLNEIEKVKGKIPEPDETNFMPSMK